MAHAAELETSVYLHLDAEKVEMEKARKDLNMPESASCGSTWWKARRST